MNLFVISSYTNTSGIGHISRSMAFADYGLKKGYFNKAYFYIHKNMQIKKKNNNFIFFNNFNFIEAKLSNIKKKKNFLLIDDYEFSAKNYKKYNKFFKLIVIDDLLNKKIGCDYYINYKNVNWDSGTYSNKIKSLVSINAIKFLGIKYYIPRLNQINIIRHSSFNIMFYEGGNGVSEDLSILINQISNLICGSLKIQIFVVKSFQNKPIIKVENNIHYLFGGCDFDNYLSRTDLLIGTTSGIIYETNLLNIPSIFYSISMNQKNQIKNLENLGHYFLISKKNLFQKKIIKLIIAIIKNYKKIKSLNKNIKVDLFGIKRIYEFIFNNNRFYSDTKFKNTSNLKIKKCNVKDINDIRNSRNLIHNRNKFIDNKLIDKIDHYIFFLSTKRQYYKFYFNEKIFAYIWDNIISINNKKFIITGWHTAKNINPLYICYFTEWHIERLSKLKIDWICVIKKENNFVYNLNKNQGFKIVSRKSDNYNYIKSYFKVSSNNYYFMELLAK